MTLLFKQHFDLLTVLVHNHVFKACSVLKVHWQSGDLLNRFDDFGLLFLYFLPKMVSLQMIHLDGVHSALLFYILSQVCHSGF